MGLYVALIFYYLTNALLTARIIVFINLPIATVAAVLLFFSLKDVPLRPAKGVTWRKLWNNFDLLGLFVLHNMKNLWLELTSSSFRILFMSGTVGLVLGFSFSSQFGCKTLFCLHVWPGLNQTIGNAPATLVPLVLGFLILIIGYFYEKHTNRDALFPSRMLNNVTVGELLYDGINRHHLLTLSSGTILIISFLHNFAFNAGTFFLALYYQVGLSIESKYVSWPQWF